MFVDMRISVVIPSYNSSATLDKTLQSLLDQSVRPYEIIVVDSSQDNGKTGDVIAEFAARSIVQCVSLKDKTIPAIGRNVGAQNATGDILAFIDSDAYAHPDWIKEINSAVANGVECGGGSYCYPPFQKWNMCAVAQFYLQFNEFLPEHKQTPAIFAPSCNFFVKKNLFDSVGGFPNVRASEDVLLGKKLNLTSQFMFIPRSIVYHIFGTSFNRLCTNQKLLGEYVAKYRKEESSSAFLSAPLAIVCAPLFFLNKLRLILPRVCRGGWGHVGAFVFSLPVFLIGLLFWTIGFVGGCLSKEKLTI